MKKKRANINCFPSTLPVAKLHQSDEKRMSYSSEMVSGSAGMGQPLSLRWSLRRNPRSCGYRP